MQITIVMNSGIDESLVQKINQHFARSFCAKLRKKSLVPFARDYWIPLSDDLIPPVYIEDDRIAENQLLSWLNDQIPQDFSVYSRAGWKISAAHLDDGTSVIAIFIAHQLIDGMALSEIIRQLSIGEMRPAVAEEKVSLHADIVDGMRYGPILLFLFMTRIFGRMGAIAVKYLPLYLTKPFTKRSRKFTADISETVLFDKEHYDNIAQQHGGYGSSLSIALAANIATAVLDSKKNKSLIVAVKGDDLRCNSVKMTKIRLRRLPSPIDELSGIKPLAKKAYSRAKSVMGWQWPWCLFSNVGPIPWEMDNIFPNINYAFGKAALWSKNDRAYAMYRGGCSFLTIYHDTIAFSFMCTRNISSEKFAEIVDTQLQYFGLKPRKIIRL